MWATGQVHPAASEPTRLSNQPKPTSGLGGASGLSMNVGRLLPAERMAHAEIGLASDCSVTLGGNYYGN